MAGLDDYAFVSLFVAHAADGRIGDDERVAILHNLRRAGRPLGYSDDTLQRIMRDTTWQYWHLLEEGRPRVLARFEKAVQALQEAFPDERVLATIHQDIARIAAADGTVDDMEAFLLRHVRRRWQRLPS